jgi:muconolactone D-isomerase
MREFLVETTTTIPEGTDLAEIDRHRAAEAVRAKELAATGNLVRLWRPAGELRSSGLCRAADEAEPHEKVLGTPPLRPWMTPVITAVDSYQATGSGPTPRPDRRTCSLCPPRHAHHQTRTSQSRPADETGRRRAYSLDAGHAPLPEGSLMPNVTAGHESNAGSEIKVPWPPRTVHPIGWASGKVKLCSGRRRASHRNSKMKP